MPQRATDPMLQREYFAAFDMLCKNLDAIRRLLSLPAGDDSELAVGVHIEYWQKYGEISVGAELHDQMARLLNEWSAIHRVMCDIQSEMAASARSPSAVRRTS